MQSCTGAKDILRSRMRAAAAALTPEARRAGDRVLADRLLALPELKEAETVLLFCGVGTEPDTRPIAEALWAAGKQVLFPKCLPHRRMEARAVRGMEELVPGVFGIPEPGGDCPAVERGKIDMVLVPAVCYDRSRFRLGQGGGYYDRYLSGYGGATVGLCRDAFLLERVPRERHDLPVERVLTESLCL